MQPIAAVAHYHKFLRLTIDAATLKAPRRARSPFEGSPALTDLQLKKVCCESSHVSIFQIVLCRRVGQPGNSPPGLTPGRPDGGVWAYVFTNWIT